MSTSESSAEAGKTFEKRGNAYWLLPEAPEYHGKDRRCDRGWKCVAVKDLGEPAKVTGYADYDYGVVLCHQCENVRAAEDVTARSFVGWEEENGYRHSYPLPNLKQVRENAFLTQLDLAELADLGEGTIGKIEQGNNAHDKTAARLARALNTTIGELKGMHHRCR